MNNHQPQLLSSWPRAPKPLAARHAPDIQFGHMTQGAACQSHTAMRSKAPAVRAFLALAVLRSAQISWAILVQMYYTRVDVPRLLGKSTLDHMQKGSKENHISSAKSVK